MNHFFMWFVFLNGIYDVLCSMVIILHQCPPLDSWVLFHTTEEIMHKYLHFSVFQDSRSMDPQLKRFLAYWIFTYGVVRINTALHSIYLSPILMYSDQMLASMSYLVEAICFQSEYVFHTPHIVKQNILMLISSCICIWLTLLWV